MSIALSNEIYLYASSAGTSNSLDWTIEQARRCLLAEEEVQIVQKKKHALLKNYTVQKAQQKISEFSRRYTSYQFNMQKNIWVFCVISEGSSDLIVQLIDKSFEPPRGSVSSDQPYICIHFTQVEDDVKLTYRLRWKKWKWPLIISGMVLYFAIPLILLCMSEHTIASYALILFGACIFFTWLIRNICHDRLTLRVFRELLYKNFDDIQFYP